MGYALTGCCTSGGVCGVDLSVAGLGCNSLSALGAFAPAGDGAATRSGGVWGGRRRRLRGGHPRWRRAKRRRRGLKIPRPPWFACALGMASAMIPACGNSPSGAGTSGGTSRDGGSIDGGSMDGGQPEGGAVCEPGASIWPACADGKACAFYVAPTGGDDSGSGTSSGPFATLERLQAALAAAPSSSKVGCLRAGSGGTYDRTATLTLTSADDGETWQFDPAGGVDTAVLDGGSSVDLIAVNGASNVTINGLALQHFNAYGINGSGSGDTIENCDVGFNVVTSWHSAGIVFGGTSLNTAFRHNYVHDLGSQGIALFDGYSTPGDINGSAIEGNVVLRAVQRMYDGGGIYVSMHGGCFVNQACAVTVTNNFVRDQGSSAIKRPLRRLGQRHLPRRQREQRHRDR
jgi:hypothetical protein